MALERLMMSMNDYIDAVMTYSEHLGTPAYVMYYDPVDVSTSFREAIMTCWLAGLSHRMCAILLLSLTLAKVTQDHTRVTIH